MDNIYQLNHKQQAYALYGTLLGDASLLKGGYIRIKHTNKQKSYVQALESLFKAWGLKVTTTYDYASKTKFGNVVYSEVRVKMTPTIARQVSRLYQNGKKIVRSYVMRRINELGLLFWWLDDGCLTVFKYWRNPQQYTTKRVMRLHTNSFSEHEQNIMSKYLFKRFGIATTISKAKSKYSGKTNLLLTLSAANFRRLIDVVYPVLHFVPADLIYKINMKYEPERLYGNVERAEKYNFDSVADIRAKQKLYCVGSSEPKSGAPQVGEDIV